MRRLVKKARSKQKKHNICGSQIRAFRRSQGKTLVELCAELEVDFEFKLDRSALGKIENGARQLSDIELVTLATALKVELMELFPTPHREALSTALAHKVKNAQEK